MINRSALRLNELVDKFLYYNELELKVLLDPETSISKSEKITHEPVSKIEEILTEYSIQNNREKDLVLDLENHAIKIGMDEFERIIDEIGSNSFNSSPEKSSNPSISN